MATPEKPTLDYSYTAFQQSQGNNAFPGTPLDNDLAGLVASISEVIDQQNLFFREDGRLENGIVTRNALSSDILLGLPAPRPWVTATEYAVDDTATINNSLYVCLVAHTSGTFSSDLSAARWALMVEFTVPAAVLDDAVTTPKILNQAVTAPKIADGAVVAAKVPDNELPASKLVPGIGLLPVGSTLDWDAPFAPAGWLFKNGQNVSRTAYLALFNVLCPTFTATTSSGSATLTGVSADLRNLGLEGVVLEGSGLPGGVSIVSMTSTTVTLSAAATATASGVQVRMFPHGVGDGATTFTLPDDRDRVSIGRGNMGGTVAARVTTTGAGNPALNTSRLGAAGGVDRHTLTGPQIPGHTHAAATTITDPGHAHTMATHTTARGAGGGTLEVFSASDGVAGDGHTTNSNVTGITATTVVSANVGGEAHPNIPPSIVRNRVIFTGVV